MFDLARDAAASLPNAIAKLGRMSLVWLSFPLPQPRRRQLERWLRGREQVAKLARADVVIVSFGKSGRTWLRVLLSGYLPALLRPTGAQPARLRQLPPHATRRIPRIFFTHDNYIQDYTRQPRLQARLLRQEGGAAGAQPAGRGGVAVPPVEVPHAPREEGAERVPGARRGGLDLRLRDAAQRGLPKIIDFMNLWAAEAPHVRELLIVRYEDLRRDTAGGAAPHRALHRRRGGRGGAASRRRVRVRREHARDGAAQRLLARRAAA